MNWRNRGLTALAGALLVASSPVRRVEGQAAPGVTGGASVLEWNARAAQLIVGPGGAAKAPPLALVDLAIVHTAIYDAVDAIEGFPFRPYGVPLDVPGPASGDAAVAAAGRQTLLALYPARSQDIETWYAASLAAIPDGEEETNGIAVGQQAAAVILALRLNDGRNAGTTIAEPPPAPGVWVRTPPALAAPLTPWARFITPWNLTSPSELRPLPPPPLSSRKYRKDYEEIMDIGSAAGSASEEQKDIARFWTDNPPLQWNRAWRGIVQGKALSGMEAARLFAMVTTASADGLIACWDAKYEYMFWRPVTAIRAGGGDPRLVGDPSWNPLVTTPNHPEYPSAHGCYSGAATNALRHFFGSDEIAFTVDSNVAGVTTPVRSYDTFSQALDEVMGARVVGGMHYRFSTEVGAGIGRKVARRAARAFRPTYGNPAGNDRDDE